MPAGIGYREIGVVASVRGVNSYQRAMRNITASTETTSGRILNATRAMNNNIFSKAGQSLSILGNQIRFIGAQIAQVGYSWTFLFTIPVVAGLTAAIKAGTEFEAQMQKIAYLGGLGAQGIEAWSRALLELAPQLGKTPQELADGLYFIASVGYRDAAQSVDVLNLAMSDLNDTTALLVQGAKASSIGMGDLGDITKITVAIARQYADETLDIVGIYDKLFVAIREAGGETDEFASTLGRALAYGPQVGATLDDILAFVSVFTRSGVSPSVAVTSIANAFGSLIDPSEKALEALNRFSYEGMRGLEALRELISDRGFSVALQSLVDTLGTDAVADIFTRRGEIGIFDVTNAEAFLEVLVAIQNASGELDAAFEAFTTTAQFQFNQLKANLNTFGITLFRQIKSPLAEILQDINDFIRRLNAAALNNPETVKFVTQLLLIAAVVGPALVILGNLIRLLGTFAVVLAIPLKVLGAFISLIGTGLALAMRTFGAATFFVGRVIGKVFSGFVGTVAALVRGLSLSLLALSKALWGAMGVLVSFMGTMVTLSIRSIGIFVSQMVVAVQAVASLAIGIATLSGGAIAAGVSALIGMLGQLVGAAAMAAAAVAGVALSALGSIVATLGSVAAAVAGAVGTIIAGLFSLIAPIVGVAAAVTGLILIFAKISGAIRPSLDQATETARDKTEKLGKNMRKWGRNILESFAQGMLDGLIAVVRVLQQIGRIISKWLKPGSPPKLLPRLTEWGSGAAAAWMEGWTTYDYSSISSIADKFSEFLNSLVPTDDTSGQIAAIEQVIALREEIQAAINEINATGSLSAGTWNQVTAAMEGASDAMKQFVALTLEAAQAQEQVDAIQDQINEAQQQHEAVLKPLQDRLEEINAIQQQAQDENRRAYLEQLIASARVPEEIKELARLELEELDIQAQIDQAESEYQDIVGPLEEQLALAQENLTMIQEQLALAQAQVDFEIEQNALLQEIADLLKQQEDESSSSEGDAIGSPLDAIVPELPDPAGDGLGNLGLDLGGGIGNLDKKLAELQEELRELGTIAQEVWGQLTTNVSTWWEQTARPAIDAFIAHPFTQEVWNTLKTGVQETIDKFNLMKPQNEELIGLWDKMKGLLSFIGLVGLSLFTGFMSIVADLGAVFGVVLGHLQDIGKELGPLAESIGDWLEGLSLLLNGDEEAGQAMMNVAGEQIKQNLASLGAAIFDAVVDTMARIGIAVARGLIEAVIRLLNGISEAAGLDLSGITTKLAEWSEEFEAFILDVGNWGTRVRQAITDWWRDLWNDPKSDWEAYYSTVETDGNGLSQWWSGIVTDWNEYWIQIGDNWARETARLKGDWELLKTSIGEKAQQIADFFNGLWLKIKGALYKVVIEFVKLKYKAIWLKLQIQEQIEAMKTKWDEFWTKVGEVILNIMTEVETLRADLQEKISNLITGYINDFIQLLNDLWTKAEEVWPGFTTAVENFWNATEWIFQAVADAIRGAIEKLGELWTIVQDFLNLGGPRSRSVGVNAKVETEESRSVVVRGVVNKDGLDSLNPAYFLTDTFESRLYAVLHDLVLELRLFRMMQALQHQQTMTMYMNPSHLAAAQAGSQDLTVNIGPVSIQGEMDMVQFEARVRKTVGKMIR